MEHVLSYMTFIPLAGAVVVLLLPGKSHNLIRWVAAVFTAPPLVMAMWLFANFDPAKTGFQFREEVAWIPAYNIKYFVGIDGLSISMVLLTALLCFLCIFASWGIDKAVKGYFALFLLLDTGMMGVFVALDFFLFYIFYELMLLPLYFLIGIWGGARREYAAIKFFLYTLLGSVFMLLVIIGLYFSVKDPQTGAHSFNMLYMMDATNFVKGSIFDISSGTALLFGIPARLLAFGVLFIAFAIKVPIVPLHTWLPDAHVEAPTPISIILAGLLLKVGGYGIFLVCLGIFPEGAIYFSWWMGLIGVVSIIYGAMNALAAADLKRLIAYSSVSHMGFVLLGIASTTVEGASGAMLQLISHGVLSSMLFFLVGVIYIRVHDREIANFRGLLLQMPIFSVFVFIAFFASLGLPGFSAFIAEAFSLVGAFSSAF